MKHLWLLTTLSGHTNSLINALLNILCCLPELLRGIIYSFLESLCTLIHIVLSCRGLLPCLRPEYECTASVCHVRIKTRHTESCSLWRQANRGNCQSSNCSSLTWQSQLCP